MIPASRYTCVVRWKKAEKVALANLARSGSISFVPLIEPTPKAFANVRTAEAMRGALQKAVCSIGQSWGNRACYVDDHLIAELGAPLGIRPLESLVREVRNYNLSCAPILRLSDSIDFGKNLVTGIANSEIVGLRLLMGDGNELSASRITASVAGWGLAPERVHVFVDQEVVSSTDSPANSLLRLPLLSRWHGVTVLGGSFPMDLRHLTPDVHELPRLEWIRFLNLLTEWPMGMPRLAFGDYGTLHAHFSEPKPGCRPSVSVRYALDDIWLVLRGYAVDNEDAGGFEQFRGHAMYLMGHPGFSGRSFCFGDRYIADRCRLGATTGNLATWLAASMNHHIARTSSSLAALNTDRAAAVSDARRSPAAVQNTPAAHISRIDAPPAGH